MFSYLSFNEIESAAYELQSSFATISSALSLLSISPAKHTDGTTCSPVIIRLTHFNSLSTDKQRPQLFISGEIHGNEKIGPLASLFTAQMLVWSAKCEIEKNSTCCKLLHDQYKINKKEIIWLTYLITRRDIYVIPTTNCMGYIKQERLESGIDPNRDFPYVTNSNKCLQSSTANLIISLFHHNIIQSVVTYHGGMEAIGYEWGDKNHINSNDKCPDNNVHKEVAKYMSSFGGSFGSFQEYKTGPINSIVYPVWGGMEDWMYASAWDKKNLHDCSSSLFSSLQTDTGRAAVFLIETADKKAPEDNLGKGVKFLRDSPSGHISRNSRVAIVAIDTVQPYVCLKKKINIKKVIFLKNKEEEDKEDKSSDKEEDEDRNNRKDRKEDRSNKRENRKDRKERKRDRKDRSRGLRGVEVGLMEMKVKWYVGGGFKVDATSIALHDALMSSQELFETKADYTHLLSKLPNDPTPYFINTSLSYGSSRWSKIDPLDPKEFSTVIRVKAELHRNNHINDNILLLTPGDHWFVIWAKMDQSWGETNQGHPQGSPQTHIANARTNSYWKESSDENIRSGGREVRGRLYWPSDPFIVRVNQDGNIEIVSHVVDCAWWTRDQFISFVSSKGDSKNEVRSQSHHPVSEYEDKEHAVPSKESYDVHGLWHDVFDRDERAEWIAKSPFSKTVGALVLICWLSIFFFWLSRCQSKRIYRKYKREDDVEI